MENFLQPFVHYFDLCQNTSERQTAVASLSTDVEKVSRWFGTLLFSMTSRGSPPRAHIWGTRQHCNLLCLPPATYKAAFKAGCLTSSTCTVDNLLSMEPSHLQLVGRMVQGSIWAFNRSKSRDRCRKIVKYYRGQPLEEIRPQHHKGEAMTSPGPTT